MKRAMTTSAPLMRNLACLGLRKASNPAWADPQSKGGAEACQCRAESTSCRGHATRPAETASRRGTSRGHVTQGHAQRARRVESKEEPAHGSARPPAVI